MIEGKAGRPGDRTQDIGRDRSYWPEGYQEKSFQPLDELEDSIADCWTPSYESLDSKLTEMRKCLLLLIFSLNR